MAPLIVPSFPFPLKSITASSWPSSKFQKPTRPSSFAEGGQFIYCWIWIESKATSQIEIWSILPSKSPGLGPLSLPKLIGMELTEEFKFRIEDPARDPLTYALTSPLLWKTAEMKYQLLSVGAPKSKTLVPFPVNLKFPAPSIAKKKLELDAFTFS